MASHVAQPPGRQSPSRRNSQRRLQPTIHRPRNSHNSHKKIQTTRLLRTTPTAKRTNVKRNHSSKPDSRRMEKIHQNHHNPTRPHKTQKTNTNQTKQTSRPATKERRKRLATLQELDQTQHIHRQAFSNLCFPQKRLETHRLVFWSGVIFHRSEPHNFSLQFTNSIFQSSVNLTRG